MTFKKRQQINTTCTICSNEVDMVIKNNGWIESDEKMKKKQRNEYSLATVCNSQGKKFSTKENNKIWCYKFCEIKIDAVKAA